MNCICSKASKASTWFVYLLFVVRKKCHYVLAWFTRRFHDQALLGYIVETVPGGKYVAPRMS